MICEPKHLNHLMGGAAKGLRSRQLNLHPTLCKGHPAKLNAFEEKLVAGDATKPNDFFNKCSGLKRREVVVFSRSGGVLLPRNRRDSRLPTSFFMAKHHPGLPIEGDLLLVLDDRERVFAENLTWRDVSRCCGDLPFCRNGKEIS